MKNINSFWIDSKEFFHYPTLIVKLNKTTRKNSYQLLCFSMILFSCETEYKLPIIKYILKHIHLVNWICRQRILNAYFEILLAMFDFDPKYKHKYLKMFRFTVTSVMVYEKNYHRIKVNHYLKYLRLKNEKSCGFRNKLREKIMNLL